MPLVLAALARDEHDPAVRALVEVLGGAPVEVSERLVDVPTTRSRRLRLAAGAELVLHDGALVALVLHLVPTSFSRQTIDLSAWVAGVGAAPDLAAFTAVLGTGWRFASGHRTFAVGGGHLRLTERSSHLVAVTFCAQDPRTVCRPEDEDCEACAGLPVRVPGDDDALDLDATLTALDEGVADGWLRASTAYVPLADLRLLHASRLMEQVESQATCRRCGRVLCLTASRDAPPTLRHLPYDVARRRPLDPLPPVEEWGDDARVAASRDAMRYVDHEPGTWFLVAQGGELYLDARYSYSAVIDSSALVRLDEPELADYRTHGHDALTRLARRIHDSAPYTESSPYRARDLYQGPGGSALRDAVSAATVEHTWAAEQRRAR